MSDDLHNNDFNAFGSQPDDGSINWDALQQLADPAFQYYPQQSNFIQPQNVPMPPGMGPQPQMRIGVATRSNHTTLTTLSPTTDYNYFRHPPDSGLQRFSAGDTTQAHDDDPYQHLVTSRSSSSIYPHQRGGGGHGTEPNLNNWNNGFLRGSSMQLPAQQIFGWTPLSDDIADESYNMINCHHLHPQAYLRYTRSSNSIDRHQRNSDDFTSSTSFRPRAMYDGIRPVYYRPDFCVEEPQKIALQTDLFTQPPAPSVYQRHSQLRPRRRPQVHDQVVDFQRQALGHRYSTNMFSANTAEETLPPREELTHSHSSINKIDNILSDDSSFTNGSLLSTSPPTITDAGVPSGSGHPSPFSHDIAFPCPHKHCEQLVLDKSLSAHYRAYHTPPGSLSVPCGTCDINIQISSRMKHIRGVHLNLLQTKCPIGNQVFSRPDATKRHVEGGCDGNCSGKPEQRDSGVCKRTRRRRREDDEDEDESRYGQTGAPIKRTRRQ